MNDTITYKVTTPSDGLTQFTFTHHNCILSVGCGPNHYASWVVGDRDDDGPKHLPTSYEVAVFGEDGHLIQITSYDTVAGWQPIDMVQTLLDKMGRDDFNIKDLEFYCD
jgi:hypothetical protein|tara:strand:+ start:179 stop:505 length:327 start_codon:yes stop_codon:yes gene_type:complete